MSAPPLPTQPQPLAQCILWKPATERPADQGQAVYPAFLSQNAIRRLLQILAQTPNQGALGFLVGKLLQDPDAKAPYLLVEAPIRIATTLEGTNPLPAMTGVWARMQDELKRKGSVLLGWYRGHPSYDATLSPDDLMTHQKFFAEPWHTALIIGADTRGPIVGVYQFPPGESGRLIPFYEVLTPESILPDGKKRTAVPWKSYRALAPKGSAAAAPAAAPSPSAPPAPPEPPPAAATPAPQPPPAVKPPTPARVEWTPSPKPEPAAAAPPAAATPILGLESTAPPPASAPGPKPPTPLPPPRASAARPSVSPPPRPSPPLRPTPPPAPPPRRATGARPALRAPRPPASRAPVVLITLAVIVVGLAAAWYFGALARFGIGPPQSTVAPPTSVAESTAAPAETTLAQAAETIAAEDTTRPISVTTPRRAAPGPVPAAGPAQPVRVEPPPPAVQTPAATPEPIEAEPVDPAVTRVDRLGDSLQTAIAGYAERARGFDARETDCTALTLAYIEVDRRLGVYNVAKNAMGGALPGSRATRDRTLYVGADSAAAHFSRSGCPRP